MIWVIAKDKAAAARFVAEHEIEKQWKYLDNCKHILHATTLRVILVDGWQERLDAGLIRIRLEHIEDLEVLCSPTPTEDESTN